MRGQAVFNGLQHRARCRAVLPVGRLQIASDLVNAFRVWQRHHLDPKLTAHARRHGATIRERRAATHLYVEVGYVRHRADDTEPHALRHRRPRPKVTRD
eukprot:scaffold4994_cov123-Isochrysis_galbana.AAC.2